MSDDVRILVIDDENIVLKSFQRIFSNEKYIIETANSGEAGLEKVNSGKYDIVITDLKMPGIGGIEVLRQVREKHPDITVIIFTGFANIETARDAIRLGAFDYVPKPFTPEELRDVVHNAVKSRQEKSDSKMLDLMAIVSHELKSPVSVVHTTADTLHRGYFGKLEPEQQKVVEAILRNCLYLEDIIRSYIDLSKMELDDLDSFKKNINFINDIVKPVIEIPENMNNIKEMPIIADLKDNPEIIGDPDLLKIVVTNLVSNAIKYGEQGTKILVKVFKEGDKCVFSIYNKGVGMTEEQISQKLFKKYSRLKQTGTEGVKGSGLGLYICKKIIEKHNGILGVNSEVGKYAEFYFKI
jgi:signal transduction histidine kinase